ncbi:MAG: hypothetical protein DIU76_08290 [Bacillota bacterium]|nr:MAG: hypothetical protein DIU76_08290 [Bacillota bacterium]
MRPDEFLHLVRDQPSDGPLVRLGTIPAGYTSGRPQVQWDGETAPSSRTYPYLSSYTPAAGDRVLAVRAGRTWVILGRVV